MLNLAGKTRLSHCYGNAEGEQVVVYCRGVLNVPVCSMRLAVVIPTRNRSDLALRAIGSVLPQLPDGSVVVVSDNSTQEQHESTLRAYVQGLARDDVQYLRPPKDLAMPAHWEWAFSQVASIPSITHTTVLTDRMIFKQGAIDHLVDLIAESPGSIISYNHDMVDDSSTPVRLHCAAWSGTTLEVTSARLLELSAAMEQFMVLPRMLNCIVPIDHLQKIRAVFGNVFDSVAPDFCFAYRTLSQVDSILHLDESLLLDGSIARSNGHSYARGQLSRDHADFVAKLGGSSLNGAAPVPGFETVSNTITSEYELIRRQTGLSRFLPVDMNAYFARIEVEISEIHEPSLARKMRALLHDHRGTPLAVPRSTWRLRLQRLPSQRPSYLLSVLLAAAVSSWPTKRLWRWVGAQPPRTRWFRFRDLEEAFEFAQSPGRRPSRTHPALRSLATPAGQTTAGQAKQQVP